MSGYGPQYRTPSAPAELGGTGGTVAEAKGSRGSRVGSPKAEDDDSKSTQRPKNLGAAWVSIPFGLVVLFKVISSFTDSPVEGIRVLAVVGVVTVEVTQGHVVHERPAQAGLSVSWTNSALAKRSPIQAPFQTISAARIGPSPTNRGFPCAARNARPKWTRWHWPRAWLIAAPVARACGSTFRNMKT